MEYTQEYRIRSSWTVRAHAGEPVAVVRVRNLQATTQAAQDAWGRERKAQPLLVSAEVCLCAPSAAASANDAVSSDTVHYGTLSKAILQGLAEAYEPRERPTPTPPSSSPQPAIGQSAFSLHSVLECIWSALTGLKVDGIASKTAEGGAARPFLTLARVRSLSVTVLLPKASLLGEGVSLTAVSAFSTDGKGSTRVDMFGVSMKLHRLRVPTLIGVNSNERCSKQVVIVDVEIDKFDYAPDVYTVLESLVVKVMTSTFSFPNSVDVLTSFLLDNGGFVLRDPRGTGVVHGQ